MAVKVMAHDPSIRQVVDVKAGWVGHRLAPVGTPDPMEELRLRTTRFRQLAWDSGSCPAASESIDVTNIVSAWASYTIDNYGFLLDGDSADGSQAKMYCSLDLGAAPCDVAAHEPTLSVTYNSWPWPRSRTR